MARSVPWRRDVSEACNWHQTQALEATIYLLRQTGPTGFLLKEDGESKNVKVFLGDPHTCTCPVFKRERDLCKHICWLLLKRFKLSVNDPLSWQLGLVEREVNEVLQGRITADRNRHGRVQNKTEEKEDGKTYVQQREIADDDVCPICQEELLSKKLPVTFCKFSCGNTIHIKCMTVWAEHQQKSTRDATIKCPMCREDFGPIELLKTECRNAGVKKNAPGVRLDRHLGVACSHCSKAPIEGKCYRCTVCPTFNMCQRCFNLPVHTTHPFQFRQKRNQRWRAAIRSLGASLPPALVNDLMNRDISEEDYDTLLQLDRHSQAQLSTLTEEALQQLPLQKVRERSLLLAPGSQCRVCLRGFSTGQILRKLPCGHKFHRECIDGWLLHSHATCPVDGQIAILNVENSRNTPEARSHQENQDLIEQSQRSQLLISATGVPYASSHGRGNANSVSRLRRPPPFPLTNMGDQSAGGLELNGARFHASHSTSSDPTLLASRTAGIHRHRNAQGNSNHRSNDSGEQPLTPGDLIQFLQGVNLQPAESRLNEFENQSLHSYSASRRLSAGSEPTGACGRPTMDELVLSNGTDVQHRRQTLRKRPSSLERTAPSIQAITPSMTDLYLGNDPTRQPPVCEDGVQRSGTTNRPPPRPRLQRVPFNSRRPRLGNTPTHTSGSSRLQLEGSAIDNRTPMDNDAMM